MYLGWLCKSPLTRVKSHARDGLLQTISCRPSNQGTGQAQGFTLEHFTQPLSSKHFFEDKEKYNATPQG